MSSTRSEKKVRQVNLKWYGCTMRREVECILRSAGCGHTRKEKKRDAKRAVEGCLQERHDTDMTIFFNKI